MPIDAVLMIVVCWFSELPPAPVPAGSDIDRNVAVRAVIRRELLPGASLTLTLASTRRG